MVRGAQIKEVVYGFIHQPPVNHVLKLENARDIRSRSEAIIGTM